MVESPNVGCFLRLANSVNVVMVIRVFKLGVMNGPLEFLTARKILPLLDLLAKF